MLDLEKVSKSSMSMKNPTCSFSMMKEDDDDDEIIQHPPGLSEWLSVWVYTAHTEVRCLTDDL